MGPLVRIILRYGLGGVVGYEIGSRLAEDPDVVNVGAIIAAMVVPAVGALANEWFYRLAKKYGWRT